MLVAHESKALRQLGLLSAREHGDQSCTLGLVGDQALGVDSDRCDSPETIVSCHTSVDQIKQRAQLFAEMVANISHRRIGEERLKRHPG